MTASGAFTTAWIRIKKHALATISAMLFYIGIVQIISAVRFPISYVIMHGINLVIERAFRDHVLLATPPYSTLNFTPVHARNIAIGVIIGVLGLFASLLADFVSQRKATQ